MAKKKATSEDKEFIARVRAFFAKYEKFKNIEARYKELQTQFYSDMDDYFSELSRGRRSATFSDINGDDLVVTKVDKIKIVWFPEKLKKKVEKRIWKQLIVKHYEVVDMAGLVAYLKSCNVDPMIFKSFIEVTESVDEKAVEALSDRGDLRVSDIAGCYATQDSKPFYRLKRRSRHEGDEL